jgi:hypothetical protein
VPVGSVNWIEEGMLGTVLRKVISEGSDAGEGFEFDLTNQFFHGLHPLGWIRRLEVEIDGIGIPVEALTFIIRNQPIPMSLVPKISDIYWQALEPVSIRFWVPGTLSAGKHQVTCRLSVSTYIFTPDIDRNDLYPTTDLALQGELVVADQPSEIGV